MQNNKFQKIIAALLLGGQVALSPALAFAQLANATPAGSLNPVPISDSGSITTNNSFNAFMTPIQVAHTACNTALKVFESSDDAAQMGLSFSSIIGGGGALAGQLAAEIAAYKTYITCEQGILKSLNGLVAGNIYTSTIKQQNIDQVTKNLQTYQDKLKTAQARFNVASQNIWKAVMITVLINTSKAIANQLVNKLVNSYKINNIKQYADSLATLAYDNQFIRQNFPDAQGQMMARAFLANPLYRTQIQPAIYQAAHINLGFDPVSLNYSDPNFYAKMASVGFANNDPYYLQQDYIDKLDISKANANASAQRQIALGNGYKAPVTCQQSLQEQQVIDRQAKALQDQMDNRKQLLNNLQQAKAIGQNVSAADLARAQVDYTAAYNAWNNAPDALAKNNPAVIMCEAISSPAVLVNQGIDALFKQLINNASQYNSNNLPGFLAQLSGIATQLGSSMVLGGITGKSSTVNEQQALGQAVTATIGATIQTVNNSMAQNLVNGIDFSAVPNTSVANGYRLDWSIDTGTIKNAATVSLVGDGITGAAGKLPLSGSAAIVTTKGGNYLLTVYDSAGRTITSATLTITLPTAAAASVGSDIALGSPAVAGAFISAAPLQARGTAAVPHLR